MRKKMKIIIIVFLVIIGIVVSIGLYLIYYIPPIADAGPDQVVSVGDATYFNGTGSDPDGEIVLYEWDFNNDGSFDWNSTESGSFYYSSWGPYKVYAKHFYRSPGDYTATLRVTDNNRIKRSDTCIIHVNPGRIEISLTSDKRSYTIGEDINITVSLKNVYSEDINVSEMSLNKSEYPSLKLEIKTPEGYIINYTGGSIRTVPNGLSLGPNETYNYSSDLWGFGNREIDYYQLQTIGDYEISAIYHSDPGWCWDSTVWEGTLYSNTLTFTITT